MPYKSNKCGPIFCFKSIELQEISYLAVLPKAHNKVAIFVPSFKKTFYNRMIGIIGRWRPRKNSEHLNLIFHHCYHLDIPSLFPSHYSLIRGGKKNPSYLMVPSSITQLRRKVFCFKLIFLPSE